MKNVKYFAVLAIGIVSGCSILSDYYHQDCAIHPDSFKYLTADEQKTYLKKCKSSPEFRKIEPTQ
ncbi:hypothetical protein SKM54_12340 [Acinetobacter faecalis]|uniref:hypothetical protein n=1 Tax=Acinetobacter faecalis TaxID=2665161 RepID=UPI002A90CEFE|nr:hypothetical protein [Acinetobacter faecalis]MDY6451140.1 hypothetical protein [Acinetobacter faecalis]MDY6483221.1 hypothetical protein [Acinetobacter faecalis]